MAKVAANQNPYGVQVAITDTPTYARPNSAFAVPAEGVENGNMDSPIGAYADTLLAQPGHTPDPMRTFRMPARDFRPDPARAPEVFWNRIDADKKQRHSVETQDADGFKEFSTGRSGKPAAPNPRLKPSPNSRVTQDMSPHTYVFTRPMWGGPRDLNGEHFSMAAHRRDYPILGTQPVRTWRNTYRLTPVPWDTDMLDVPPNDATDIPSARIQGVEVPMSRNWRL